MIVLNFSRTALSSCAAAALLAGCTLRQAPGDAVPAQGDTVAVTQGALPFGTAQGRLAQGDAPFDKLTMTQTSSSGDLLYVAVGTTAYIQLSGSEVAGEITQQPYLGPLAGSDATNGEMCFDDGQNDVYVYSHGGQLLNTIKPPNHGNYITTTDCAFDSTTGDLATTAAQYYSARTPKYYYVAVYSTASGEPTIYRDPKLGHLYDAVYDSSGDLFVNGCCDGSNAYVLAELPKGGKTFVEISLPQSLEQSFSWQDLDWDGKYVAVVRWTLAFQTEIDRLSVSKGSATIVGTTVLSGARPRRDSEQFTIAGDRVIGPLRKGHFPKTAPLGVWRYPAGGAVSRTLHIPLSGSKHIGAVVVSAGDTP